VANSGPQVAGTPEPGAARESLTLLHPVGDEVLEPTGNSVRLLQGIGNETSRDHRSQRGMRETITIWLLGLLCAVIGLSFAALLLDQDIVAADRRVANLKALLDVVVGPVVTLLSSVIGFYFGLQSAQRRSGDDAESSGSSKRDGGQ
jgi:hypothetical protein